MTNNDILIFNLLCRMFPGNDRVPSFKCVLGSDRIIGMVDNTEQLAELYSSARNVCADIDINETIKYMKKSDYDLVSKFIDQAIGIYFSMPSVVEALTGSKQPLYPNSRVLKDINYDLIEPVYSRMLEG